MNKKDVFVIYKEASCLGQINMIKHIYIKKCSNIRNNMPHDGEIHLINNYDASRNKFSFKHKDLDFSILMIVIKITVNNKFIK